MNAPLDPSVLAPQARPVTVTHEAFIHAVRDAVITRLQSFGPSNVAHALLDTKLVYGLGEPGLRGVTWYGQWTNGHTHHFCEICAFGERDWVQLAGTTIHELGHAISQGAGHGKGWADACKLLGLRYVRAAGTNYSLGCFTQDVRMMLANMGKPDDGAPSRTRHAGIAPGATVKVRPCGAGIGTKGGKSRGVGSGSRLRKYVCDCGQIIRASTDTLEATHSPCGSAFKQA